MNAEREALNNEYKNTLCDLIRKKYGENLSEEQMSAYFEKADAELNRIGHVVGEIIVDFANTEPHRDTYDYDFTKFEN